MGKECTINEACKLITGALVTLKDLFDESHHHLLYRKEQAEHSFGRNNYIDIYFPRKIGIKEMDGIKLKDEMGLISIHEKYLKTKGGAVQRVSYVYRYMTSTRSYDFSHSTKGKSQLPYYYFHYDMDLEYEAVDPDKNHPPAHLQVLHDSPRFKTEEMEIVEFLDFIRDTFYTPSTLSTNQKALF